MATSAKNKARRKKRISKHILKSQQSEEISKNPSEKDNSERQAIKRKKQEKQPSDVSAYLNNWKHRNDGAAWKFNKNTQSWLIRYMYDPKKINKATFTTLLEYLTTIQGGNLLNRIQKDARRRVLRYKGWEKQNETADDPDNAKDMQLSSTVPNINGDDEENRDEYSKWILLSDHDKRKEYKRTRKIIETLDNCLNSGNK